MCGIAGWNVTPEYALENLPVEKQKGLMDSLIQANLHRGRDAIGWMAYSADVDEGDKERAARFFKTPGDRMDVFPSTSCNVVGIHTRGASLGHPSNNKNNHPCIYGYVMTTHNGHVTNHKWLKDEYAYDDLEWDKLFLNDSEVDSMGLSVYINSIITSEGGVSKENIETFAYNYMSDIKGGAAWHSMLYGHPQYEGVSFIVRARTFPLNVLIFEHGILYASEARAVRLAADALGLDKTKIRRVLQRAGVVFKDGRPLGFFKGEADRMPTVVASRGQEFIVPISKESKFERINEKGKLLYTAKDVSTPLPFSMFSVVNTESIRQNMICVPASKAHKLRDKLDKADQDNQRILEAAGFSPREDYFYVGPPLDGIGSIDRTITIHVLDRQGQKEYVYNNMLRLLDVYEFGKPVPWVWPEQEESKEKDESISDEPTMYDSAEEWMLGNTSEPIEEIDHQTLRPQQRIVTPIKKKKKKSLNNAFFNESILKRTFSTIPKTASLQYDGTTRQTLTRHIQEKQLLFADSTEKCKEHGNVKLADHPDPYDCEIVMGWALLTLEQFAEVDNLARAYGGGTAYMEYRRGTLGQSANHRHSFVIKSVKIIDDSWSYVYEDECTICLMERKLTTPPDWVLMYKISPARDIEKEEKKDHVASEDMMRGGYL